TRSKTRSPGFGVSSIAPRMPASRRSRTEAGARSRTPRRSRTSRAVANVVGSGAVGPEAMTSTGSPMTSESARVTTVAGHRAGVGHRMAGFGEPDPSERRCVAVLDDDEALADPVAQNVLCRPRHRAARLPAAQDHDARVTRLDVEVGPDERAHIAGREGGLPDRARVLARAHDESLRRRSPASRSTSSVFGKQNRIVEPPLRIPKDLARPVCPEAALECI